MSNDSGTKLGLYKILAPPGTGGRAGLYSANYTRDGSRFLIAAVAVPPEVPNLNVIVNWQPTMK